MHSLSCPQPAQAPPRLPPPQVRPPGRRRHRPPVVSGARWTAPETPSSPAGRAPAAARTGPARPPAAAAAAAGAAPSRPLCVRPLERVRPLPPRAPAISRWHAPRLTLSRRYLSTSTRHSRTLLFLLAACRLAGVGIRIAALATTASRRPQLIGAGGTNHRRRSPYCCCAFLRAPRRVRHLPSRPLGALHAQHAPPPPPPPPPPPLLGATWVNDVIERWLSDTSLTVVEGHFQRPLCGAPRSLCHVGEGRHPGCPRWRRLTRAPPLYDGRRPGGVVLRGRRALHRSHRLRLASSCEGAVALCRSRRHERRPWSAGFFKMASRTVPEPPVSNVAQAMWHKQCGTCNGRPLNLGDQ